MKSNTQVSFRMDEDVKKQAESILDELGLNMSTAITMFVKSVIRTGGIPLELNIDPYYRDENQKELTRRIENSISGKSKAEQVTLTMDELEAIVNG